MPQGKPEVAAQEYRRLILHFPMRLTFNKVLLQGGALQCIASCKFQASLNSTFPFYCVRFYDIVYRHWDLYDRYPVISQYNTVGTLSL